MKALVLGFGKSGKPAAKLLIHKGYSVCGIDKDITKFDCTTLKNHPRFCFLEDTSCKNHSQMFSQIKIFSPDLIVLSSGIKKDHIICEMAENENISVISEVELAFRYLENKTIAITGTNGKTTTAMLVSSVLNDNRVKASAVGNIGISLCSYVLDNKDNLKDEVLVVELSSFQLDSLSNKNTRKLFDVGLIINIEPDHLNWHGNFENYINAKLNLRNCLKDNRHFYVSKKLKKSLIKEIDNDCSVYDAENPFEKETTLNENICAAFKVCQYFGVDKQQFGLSYKKFIKPEHRLELVCMAKGVSFYNDSKSTNISSTIYAVNNIKGPIILIAGGEEKKLDFSPWKKELKNKVKYIFLIGECAKRIEKKLKMFDVEITYTLDRAVDRAFEIAKKNDNILLSPGSSSFDQFKDFQHRGDTFKKLVRFIEKRES